MGVGALAKQKVYFPQPRNTMASGDLKTTAADLSTARKIYLILQTTKYSKYSYTLHFSNIQDTHSDQLMQLAAG